MKTTATCCSKQILEAAAKKTAVVWSLTSHHTNHPNKPDILSTTDCSKGKLISNVLLETSLYRHILDLDLESPLTLKIRK